MSWRRQLPAYSPLTLRAVLSGAAGLVTDAGAARAAVMRALAGAFDCTEILLAGSGTSALTLAIRGALASRAAASVALPAYGCYDLATAADGAGFPVLLYDLDPATLAPDPASLRAALDQGARAVVLAHWYGVPADAEPVRAVVQAAGGCLIEDAAQGAGARMRGRSVGIHGDLTVLSFGRGKGITAGRGGALLARGAAGSAAVARVRAEVGRASWGLRELVFLKAQWLLGRPSLYALPLALPWLQLGETVYHAPAPLRGMSGVAARTLANTLRLNDHEVEVRRAHAQRLLARAGAGLARVAVPAGGEAGYLRLPFLASPAARQQAEGAAARALGIMPGYPRALCDLPGFAERVLNRGTAFPGARTLAERLVTLPVHSRLGERDLAALEAWAAARSG